jgi:hypothetical protein
LWKKPIAFGSELIRGRTVDPVHFGFLSGSNGREDDPMLPFLSSEELAPVYIISKNIKV